jgi:hypothetical protein
MSFLPWSYSGLSQFVVCPRQYQAVRVTKEIPFVETDAIKYGKALHSAAEFYIKANTALPAEFAFIQPYLDRLLNLGGKRYTELKMAMAIKDREFQTCDYWDSSAWHRGIADLIITDTDRERAFLVDYKGLALDTKIPTPTGFTTMGEIQVGDTVFSESGDQCTVIGKSNVKQLPCYRVTFTDTTSVVCDEEHLWKLADGKVVGVHDLMGHHNGWQRIKPPKILTAAPLALPDVELPIDPYVLGLWLADGTCAHGEITKPDSFIWEEIQRRGYEVDMSTGIYKDKCPTRTVKKLRTQLRLNGLLNDKHIPAVYLRAGYQQRLDLLRGLMDGDGSANYTRKQAVYSTTNPDLADAVCELLSTLGQRPLKSTANFNGFGLDVVGYPVSFRPIGINPFLLPRKADIMLPGWGAGDSWFRRIKSVEAIPSVPTQCIMVDSNDHTFLCTERMIPTHNTGKSAAYADTMQMALLAALIFLHFPRVKTVKSMLLFVKAGSVVKSEYDFDSRFKVFAQVNQDLKRLKAAHESGVFNPTKNNFCARWCQVTSCVHNGNYSE